MFSIVVYALLLGLCLTLFVLLMWQREAKSSTRAHSWRLGHEQGRAQAKAAYAQQVQRITAYEQLLQGHLGGVGKRLADTREVAELIQRHAPGLLKEADGLAHLLHGNDEFLSQLLNVYVATDQDAANAQLRAAARRPAGVYADVFEAAGVAAPGSIVGKHFGLALEAGLLVIRATEQHGGSGKITLARRDLERFFNDLAAKPRSLGEELAAAVTCRGLYRVDMHGDARLGQLVVEVAAPSSGRLYLGAPQQEEEPLRELKSLKRASLRLLEDEAKSTTRRTAAQRARILRRDALLEHLPESGLCGSCEGDVTMRLRLGDKPMCCPLCGTRWAD